MLDYCRITSHEFACRGIPANCNLCSRNDTERVGRMDICCTKHVVSAGTARLFFAFVFEDITRLAVQRLADGFQRGKTNGADVTVL